MEATHQNCTAENHRINISNIENGAILCYSLVLIKGQIITNAPNACWLSISNEENTTLHLKHFGIDSTISESRWPVLNSEFKLLVDLNHGINQMVLEYCGSSHTLEVEFSPRNTNLNVTPVYIICKGHDGRFQAPEGEDNSVESACKRIAIGARLIQCLTAEKLHEATFERKSFQLIGDYVRTNQECMVFYSQLPVELARHMENEELWAHFGRELMMSPLGSAQSKFLAFLSCTRYCSEKSVGKPQSHAEMLSMTEAHVALGGGGLALFGTACLHTWPQDVAQVMDRFLDETKVDPRFMDDSCYRGTYGGCFATTLGSVCHELGHTFDLGHSIDGIMGRGFDHVDLVFTLQPSSDVDNCSEDGNRNVITPDNDIKLHSTVNFSRDLKLSYTMSSPMKKPLNKDLSCRKKQLSKRTERDQQIIKNDNLKFDCKIPCDLNDIKDQTFWSDSCAALLNFHRWFNDDDVSVSDLKFEPHRRLVHSTTGVRVVEIRDETGLVIFSWQFLKKTGRNTFLLPSGAICHAPHTLVAEDSTGNIVKYTFLQSI